VNDPESWALIDPADVDHGELNGLSPQACFILGAEWEAFASRLATGKPFTAVINAENTTRLVAMAERHSRFVEERPNHAPGWATVWVGGTLGANKRPIDVMMAMRARRESPTGNHVDNLHMAALAIGLIPARLGAYFSGMWHRVGRFVRNHRQNRDFGNPKP
jgi:hypothetical protein